MTAAQSDRLEVDEPGALDALETLLSDAVGRRMMADVPLGAFLSGGIDSSLVVALMQARSSRPIKTFAVGFDEKRYDEAAHARAVAKYIGTEHSEVVVSVGRCRRGSSRAALLVRRAFRYPLADSRHVGLAAGAPRGHCGALG